MLWSVMHLIFKTSSVTPDFFTFLILSYHFLPAVKVLKKSVRGKFWARTSLRADRSGRQVLLYSLGVSRWRGAVFKYKIVVVVVVVVDVVVVVVVVAAVVVAAAVVVVLFHFGGIQATGNLTPSIGGDLHSLHGFL